MNFERSIPFFTVLIKSPNVLRMKILQAFPTYVVDDLVDIVRKLVSGDISITRIQKDALNRYKRPILSFVNTKSRRLTRKIMHEQEGGFISIFLPIVLESLDVTRLK